MVKAWKVIANLAKLASNLDELDVVAKHLDDIAAAGGYKVWKGSSLKPTIFKSVDDFADTFDPARKLSSTVRGEAYNYFKQGQWKKLEELFNTHRVNVWNGLSYPPNRGFVNYTKAPLKVGARIDRYGGKVDEITGKLSDEGKYFANEGEVFTNRALPAGTKQEVYTQYEVIKEIPNVKQGEAIPWFGQKGGGVQYELDKGVDWLIEKGYIRRISARTSDNVLLPLGRGSTGRIVANNITEQLAMKEIRNNPSSGKIIKTSLSDSRWSGWVKMSNQTAHGVEIHFNALWENGVIKAVDDFKFITP